MKKIDFATAKAFITQLNIKPYQSGKLDGLTFAVKDLISIANTITGFGNPTWEKHQPKAVTNAVCVEQLLSAGATCLGKTITDEFAYSLIGENYFYGTPLNPKAPDRVPGGSSSGSASAVACELLDFALGTDTGGSVRVPASNCGIWGYRPSHGMISVAGINAFAPTFDTVGVLAKDANTLDAVTSVLLGLTNKQNSFSQFFIAEDIVSICDAAIQNAFTSVCELINKKYPLKKINLSHLDERIFGYELLYKTYVTIQSAEIWSTLGQWIHYNKPILGPVTEHSIQNTAKALDRSQIQYYIELRKHFAEEINRVLQNNILCFPTTPALPPLRNTIGQDIRARQSKVFYVRALGMNAIAGLARLPQISIPFMEIDHIPIGFSILTAYGQDDLLLAVAAEIEELL